MSETEREREALIAALARIGVLCDFLPAASSPEEVLRLHAALVP
jgi:hypothetical protein